MGSVAASRGHVYHSLTGCNVVTNTYVSNRVRQPSIPDANHQPQPYGKSAPKKATDLATSRRARPQGQALGPLAQGACSPIQLGR